MSIVRLSSIVAVLAVVASASGCGGNAAERSPEQVDSPTEQPATASAPAASGPTVAQPTTSPSRLRPLTTAQRNRLKMIAGSVDRAIDLFDKTVRSCPKRTREACIDRAWAVIVVDLDWPPYYLRRYDARLRGCESLAFAVRGVNGFVLAARQVDYGDPADYGTKTRRLDYLAAVDGLRHVPTDLRAGASDCR